MFDGMFEGIRNNAREMTGRHAGDLALGKYFHHGRADIGGGIVHGYGPGLFLLVDLTEYFTDAPSGLPFGRTAEDIGAVVENKDDGNISVFS